MQIISSQHYLDEDIVAAKMAAEDFEVLISPVFEFEGQTVAVVLDGHHSLAAAKRAGVAPDFVEATKQDNDRVALLESTPDHEGSPDAFLEATWVDGDYYNVETGECVW